MTCTVFGDIQSGNCFKIRLALDQLGLPYQWRHVDILNKETRTPEFLAMNPNGKIPVLVLPEGSCLAESNAILHYLAEGSSLLPADRLLRAQVLQWMFFEQYSIADIALYAYTHVAPEGGFDLANYPAVKAWLARVAAQPGYRGMDSPL